MKNALKNFLSDQLITNMSYDDIDNATPSIVIGGDLEEDGDFDVQYEHDIGGNYQ